MSYPPRPPMQMGGMPPMMQGGYGMMPNRPMTMMGMPPQQMNMMPGRPLMGMSPHNMGPRPPMRPMAAPTAPNNSNTGKDMKSSGGEDKPPATTVFVGNIVDKAPDPMIRQMLQRCGNVLSWKRVQGASGKLQAFGFCEFEDPEATLRCIRLLNDWAIVPGKKLLVKVDAKTQDILDQYRKSKKEKAEENKNEKVEEEKEEGEEEDDTEEKKGSDGEVLDEMTLREDRVAKAGIDAVMKEYSRELASITSQLAEEAPNHDKKSQDKNSPYYKDQGLEGMDLDSDKIKSISAEIESFRSRHKDDEKTEKDLERERERIARRKRELEEQERERERRREREREREREERREKREDRSRRRRSSSSGRSNSDDEEEEIERKITERRLRDKEAQYQERLRAWETRERKKQRDYEKEGHKDSDRRKEERREAKRLKEFLEDYDDEKHDQKYYRGSALQRRQKEREKEMEADARDRQREREEVEELKRQLLAKGGSDVDDQIAKLEAEKDAHLLPRMRLEDEDSGGEADTTPVSTRPTTPSPPPQPPQPQQQQQAYTPDRNGSADDTAGNFSPAKMEEADPVAEPVGDPVQLPIQSGAQAKRRKLTAAQAFAEEEEAEEEEKRRRKLVPIDYSDTPKPLSAEQTRIAIKKLIEDIPTAKEDLFKYPVDWNIVDNSLMENRIKPWITKKIIEYIGEEEPSLTDFICQKVMSRCNPATVITDISMILDEEAELFVVKMWRLLIYETEAKKAGIVNYT